MGGGYHEHAARGHTGVIKHQMQPTPAVTCGVVQLLRAAYTCAAGGATGMGEGGEEEDPLQEEGWGFESATTTILLHGF